MLKKRIIPCLDIKDNRVVKGIHFEGLRDAGNPLDLAIYYANAGADELVFLDITATTDRRKTVVHLVEEIAAGINIPFTVGGGIHSLIGASEIIQAGSDKISLNSAAVTNPSLITDIAKVYGSQAVVVAIDAKWINGDWTVVINGGNTPTELPVVEWAQKVEQLGAGEILLTSMNNDGVKRGYNIALINAVCDHVNVPVIASGGAGIKEHFADVFTLTKVSAALAAGVFHYREIDLQDLKKYLQQQYIPIRCN